MCVYISMCARDQVSEIRQDTRDGWEKKIEGRKWQGRHQDEEEGVGAESATGEEKSASH